MPLIPHWLQVAFIAIAVLALIWSELDINYDITNRFIRKAPLCRKGHRTKYRGLIFYSMLCDYRTYHCEECNATFQIYGGNKNPKQFS